MKPTLRWIVGALAVAVLAAGCVLTSAQILVHFDLPNPVTIGSATGFYVGPVDLNTISDYAKHKDKLKGLTDLAVLGTFTNRNPGTPSGTVTYIRITR